MLYVAGFIVVAMVMLIMFFVKRYKRCPSDKVLVVYGKTGKGSSAKCYAGGAAFIWPVIQDYAFLDLTPISIDVDLKGALSKQNIRVDVPSQFTVGISNEPGVMQNAAERLLGINRQGIYELGHNIIVGQMRLVIATMDIEDINSNRDQFLLNVTSNVGTELKKIGLQLINVNVTDIQDESGYIQALGQEAAAQAINEAKIKVAEEERKGDIGKAGADKVKRIEVAQANTDAEVGESASKAKAVEGENLAQIRIAQSDAERNIEMAKAHRETVAAEKVNEAKALEEGYAAKEQAEIARAKMEEAKRKADEVVDAKIKKEKEIIDAEAHAKRIETIALGEANKVETLAKGEAMKIETIAQGEAKKILLKYEAEAEGVKKLLEAQAQGLDKIIQSAGGDAQAAIGLMLVDKIPELAKIQADAIKDLSIDKVVVYDNGQGDGVKGFVKGLYGMMPQVNDFLKQSGMALPTSLVQGLEEEKTEEVVIAKAEAPKAKKEKVNKPAKTDNPK